MRRSSGYKSGFVDAMHCGKRHRLARAVKNGWLIHVIPEASEAVLDELLVVSAPPGARLLLGEIGKDARSGPDNSAKNRAIEIVDEVISSDPGVVRRIAF